MPLDQGEALRKRAFYALLRKDFLSFLRKCFEEVSPNDEFLMNWHLRAFEYEIGELLAGETTRLLINVPPRTLKSIVFSVALVAWALGQNPKLKLICVSYAQDLADDLGRQCLKVMTSEWYAKAFPKTRLSRGKRAPNHFVTTAGGYRYATSVGGALTGMGGDIIIVDDPIKADQAQSNTERIKVNKWYDNTLVTRLNNKNTGRILLVMQRLHIDDLSGHVLQQDEWRHVCIPATATADRYIQIEENADHLFKAGEILHPERENAAALKRIERSLGTYNFSAQYLQEPTPVDGSLVKWSWMQFYDQEPPADRDDEIVISWDTASKVKELNSFSVGTVWQIKKLEHGKLYYLLDLVRLKAEYPDLRRAVVDLKNRWRPSTVLIEDKASGLSLIQDLRREGFPLEAVTPDGDKLFRLLGQTSLIQQGRLFVPRNAPWLDQLRLELLQFPQGKYTDQVDSISQLLNWSENRVENICTVQPMW